MTSLKPRYGTVAEMLAGGLRCPICKLKGLDSPMRAMTRAGGIVCGIAGNTWKHYEKRWSVCNYSVFVDKIPDDDDETKTKFLVRPTTFPVIETPTGQQVAIRTWFALPPMMRGGRMMIVNAGPGCAKTSTASWSAEAVWQRFGFDMTRFEYVAFNRNAKTVLLGKLPYAVDGIFTLNGLGMRMQKYRGGDTDEFKLHRVFADLVKSLPEADRPSFEGIGELIELVRACGLYAPPGDQAYWAEAIKAVSDRFGLLEGREDSELTFQRWLKYAPWVIAETLARKDDIDLGEQWSRAVYVALAKTGLRIRPEMAARKYAWTAADLELLASIVRAVELPSPKGLVIDEAQDLCLTQLLFYLAATWRSSELVLIGDDKTGEPGLPGYKAGQGIYGWRGAFGGVMTLAGRLWTVLTGEAVADKPLSVTHRCCPEVVDAIHPLNTVLTSSRPRGKGFAIQAPMGSAFGLWLGMPETLDGKPATAYWITRTTRAAGQVFMKTIKARVPCAFRGGDRFTAALESVFKMAAGVARDRKTGEYPGATLAKAKERLREAIREIADGDEEREADLTEAFVLSVIEECEEDPSVLAGVAGLPSSELALGNIRRFLLAFCDKDAARCVTNVYRVKGDEATWAFVSDCDAFNTAWGGDVDEAAACRLVACSRAADGLVVVGHLDGVVLQPMADVPAIPQATNQVFALVSKPEEKPVFRGKVVKLERTQDGYTWNGYDVLKGDDKKWWVKPPQGLPIGSFKTLDQVRGFLQKA